MLVSVQSVLQPIALLPCLPDKRMPFYVVCHHPSGLPWARLFAVANTLVLLLRCFRRAGVAGLRPTIQGQQPLCRRAGRFMTHVTRSMGSQVGLP